MYISISEHVIQIRKIFYPFYTIEEYLRREKSGILLAILQNNQLEVIFYFQKNLFIGNHINMIYIYHLNVLLGIIQDRLNLHSFYKGKSVSYKISKIYIRCLILKTSYIAVLLVLGFVIETFCIKKLQKYKVSDCWYLLFYRMC